MTDYREEAYRLLDETIFPKLVLTLFIGLALGLASFIVLESYQATPTDDINVSEFYDNDTKQCLDPETLQENSLNTSDYSEYVCEPVNKTETTDNKKFNFSDTENFSTIPDNLSVQKQVCRDRNGTVLQGNESNLTEDEDGVYCRL